METIRYQLEDGIATLTFDQPNSAVNTMCAQWQRDLTDVVMQVQQDKSAIKGIVLASAKKTFFAGADLKALMRGSSADAVAIFNDIEQMKRNFRALETFGVPVVSCVNGAALGGGWEVALVGHCRIAVDDPKIQLGLPEITLGLIPGASGITKMTRLLGLQAAQPFIVEATLFSPQRALELGLVQQLVATVADLRPAALAWIAAHPQSQQPWDIKGYKMPGGTPASPALAGLLSVAPAMLHKASRGLYPAPEAALCAMVEGAQVDFDTALRIESRYLAKVASGMVARNMVNTFFFDMQAVRSGQSRPQGIAPHVPAKVGILGAGMMGAGIAWAQASRGISTVLKDVSRERAEQGKALSLKLSQTLVDKKRMTPQAQTALMERICATDQLADLQGCELIIEAVFEQRELKAAVTQQALPMLAPDGIFASNTSTLPIESLAKASPTPEKFIGIHFFSPVDKMKLVEIIRGPATNDATLARAFDYVHALGKLPVVVRDGRGFYTSRTFGTYVMEAATMLAEGIPAAVIENAALQCGMPVGPLAVLDETALSLSVQVMQQTQADYALEGKTYTPSRGELLVQRMVQELQRPGRAGGAGFYDYQANGKKTLWPRLKELFERADYAYSVQDIQDRLLYRQAVETARCLQEGVLTSVHDGNIASIFGIGFPAWTGGALQFIYGMGMEAFCQRAAQLEKQFGAGFAVSAELQACLEKWQPKY